MRQGCLMTMESVCSSIFEKFSISGDTVPEPHTRAAKIWKHHAVPSDSGNFGSKNCGDGIYIRCKLTYVSSIIKDVVILTKLQQLYQLRMKNYEEVGLFGLHKIRKSICFLASARQFLQTIGNPVPVSDKSSRSCCLKNPSSLEYSNRMNKDHRMPTALFDQQGNQFTGTIAQDKVCRI